MKIKFIFAVPIISILLYLIISSSSCDNENPIIPPPPITPPDTVSRFIWNKIHVGGPIRDIYVADTNDIYIDKGTACQHFDGNSFYYINFQEPNFGLESISGYDKNNIFFMGTTILNGSEKIGKLKKYSNGIITTFILDTSKGGNYVMEVIGPNQVWISLTNNYVIFFNDGNFTKYILEANPRIIEPILFNNKNNILYAFPIKNILDSFEIHTLKFNGMGFDLLKTDCLNWQNPVCLTQNMLRCGDDLIMTKIYSENKLYYFNGNNWIYHSQFDSTNTSAYKIGGWSKDSLIAMCLPRNGIYTYNGKKWRYENGSPILNPPGPPLVSNIRIKYDKVFLHYFDGINTNDTYLIIGKPNKNIR